jgi:hypothetical protein
MTFLRFDSVRLSVKVLNVKNLLIDIDIFLSEMGLRNSLKFSLIESLYAQV